MNKYNDEYYILFPDYDFKGFNICLKPTLSTSKRRFHYKELVYGDSPLIFENKYKDNNSKELGPILFSPPSIIVNDTLKNKIKDVNFWGGEYYPAIYIDSNGDYNDDYWLVNMFDKLDCWDRDLSVYEQDEADDTPHVIKYSLCKNTLDNIKESDRLIFKMGAVDLPKIFIHKKVLDILNRLKVKGIKTIKVSDYELGLEF